MKLSRSLSAQAVLLALLIVSPGSVHAGGFTVIQSQVGCSNGTSATVSWMMTIDPMNPPDPVAEWVGYDVYRRSTGDCGAYVRLNPVIIPKAAAFEPLMWEDPYPPSATAVEYFVDVVDAERQHVLIGPADVFTRTWTSCPQLSAPVTVGRIEDWGWALAVQPCAGSCYPHVFFDDESRVAELRPYAGTGQVVSFFGAVGCCAVEGPSIDIDRYEFGACGVTPVTRSTWGRLKSIYR